MNGPASSRDALIVGGGVMGSSIALGLATAGARVLVLERAVPGAEASSAAAGILGPQAESEEDGPLYRLGIASRQRWPALAAEIERLTGEDVGLRRSGLLMLAHDPARLETLAARARWQAASGQRAELLDHRAARALEPALADGIVGALWLPDEAQVDAQRLARLLPAAARRAGAEVRASARVLRVVPAPTSAGVAAVELEGGERLEARHVIVAAGAWTESVPGLGLPEGTITPARGQMVVLEPPRDALPRHVLFTGRGYVVPRADGTALCGSTMERVGFSKEVTAAGVHSILDQALAAVPGLAAARLVTTWAGFRPCPRDGLPLIGPVDPERRPGLHVASGHHRNGILLTPITADLVVAFVMGTPPHTPHELTAPFAAARTLAPA